MFNIANISSYIASFFTSKVEPVIGSIETELQTLIPFGEVFLNFLHGLGLTSDHTTLLVNEGLAAAGTIAAAGVSDPAAQLAAVKAAADQLAKDGVLSAKAQQHIDTVVSVANGLVTEAVAAHIAANPTPAATTPVAAA